MKYYPKLSGELVYLSPVNPDEYDLYTKWLNDPSVTDNIGISSTLISAVQEKEQLGEMAKSGYHFAIVRKEDHQAVGNISFMEINPVSRNAVYGLFIGEEENRGRGYGTEATRLLLKYGFETLNLHNVMLQVFSFNERAIACYQKIGFQVIGTRRQAYFLGGRYHDIVFMDLLSSDF